MTEISQRFDQPPFDLAIEAPATLTTGDEIELLRAAVARNPDSPKLRHKLAVALTQLDAFDEAIAMLETVAADAPDFASHFSLGLAYLSRETEADDIRAFESAQLAETLTEYPANRAAALALAGKVLTRQGRTDEALATLTRALDEYPGDKDAFKRVAALHLAAGEPEKVVALTDDLLAKGVCHARLLAARVLAFAKLGDAAGAKEAAGLDRLLYRRTLTPPPGKTLEEFNAAIRDELRANRGLRYDRYGTASTQTWRLDQPSLAGSVMVQQLQTLIRDAVVDYVGSLAGYDHPWINGAPSRGMLHNWCVMTDAEGFELWHVHQFGWISGVYYVDIPEAVTEGDDKGGCIAFGLPDDMVGEEAAAAFGEILVRPTPGLLMLFPSHSYHRTFAHGADERRICLAFDIQPL